MAPLGSSDRFFLEHRRARKHVGLYVLPGLLALLVLVWGLMFVWWPLAVNPNAVLGASETGLINCGSGALSRYALGATLLVNVVFALLSASLVLAIVWSKSERRYLRLLEKFEQDARAQPHEQLPSPSSEPVRP